MGEPKILSEEVINDIAQLAGMVMRASEKTTEQVQKNDWFRALLVYAEDVERIHIPVLYAMRNPNVKVGLDRPQTSDKLFENYE